MAVFMNNSQYKQENNSVTNDDKPEVRKTNDCCLPLSPILKKKKNLNKSQCQRTDKDTRPEIKNACKGGCLA